jgi:hypothetical protein
LNNDNQFDYSSNGASNQVGQKMIFLVKIANRFSSNGIVGQVEQIKEKTFLVMMVDGFLVE